MAKITSYVAIPVVIAVVGGLIQSSLSSRNVAQQYVQLAVSILTQSKAEVDPELREWAVDLLNMNSPTRLGVNVAAQLKAGTLNLPPQGNPLEAPNLRLAQRYLKRLKYYGGAETGAMDEELFQAVSRFQRDNALESDGYPGGKTIRKLLETYEARYCQP